MRIQKQYNNQKEFEDAVVKSVRNYFNWKVVLLIDRLILIEYNMDATMKGEADKGGLD